MKVRLLHTADVSPGHVRSAFSGLAPPLAPGEAVVFRDSLAGCYGRSRAHLDGGRGILSLARLRPPEENELTEEILLHRLRVEVAHELGHAAGLVHCVVNDCAMHRSLWPESVDLKNPEFCAPCLARLPGGR